MFVEIKSKLRQWSRILVVWLVCLGCVGVFYFLILSPQQRVTWNQSDKSTQEAKRVDFLQRFSSPQARNKNLAEMEELGKRHASLLFRKDDLNRFDLRMNEIATQSRLVDFSCRDINPDLGAQFPKLKLLGQRKLRLSFKCSFPDFLNFINALERQQPLVLVSEYTLRRLTDNSEQLAGDVELAVLYLTTK
jgi:hypothetical protein